MLLRKSRGSLASLSSLTSVKNTKKVVRITEKSLIWDERMARYLHGYLQFILCVLAGLFYSSVISLSYLCGALFSICAVAFGFSIHWLELVCVFSPFFIFIT